MNFFKKLNNNNGSAESAMFVFGVMIFATIVVFSLSVFGLTWQRYLSTREISNMSRLYAIRSRTMYYHGTEQISPEGSEFANEMKDTLARVVQQTNIKEAKFVIVTKDNVKLLEIDATRGDSPTLWAVDYSHFREVDYGDVLLSSLTVSYDITGFQRVATPNAEVNSYVLNNRFAFEQKASNSSIVG
jgi:hypothetical protein